jgi:hypothetical protein
MFEKNPFSAEQHKESIRSRESIEAPPNFVSIYHETKSETLSNIDKEGLVLEHEASNIGGDPIMVKRNAIIDKYRPNHLVEKGISRSNIFGYPFLEHGHGLIGADQRYIEVDERTYRDNFDLIKKHRPAYLQEIGTPTYEEYVAKMRDPDYLRSRYPGEVLQTKVDPERCYVGDLEFITRIYDDMKHGWSEAEAVETQSAEYWKKAISLKDFLKWYKKPEWAEDGDSIKDAEEFKDGEPDTASGYLLRTGAPDHFPNKIDTPEIMIPDDIPQEHIKLLP